MPGRLTLWLIMTAMALGTTACAGGATRAGGALPTSVPRIWGSVGASPALASGGVVGSEAIALGRAEPAPYVSGTLRRYQVRGRWYEPREQTDYDEVGMASWYGPGFDGRATATGERFDQDALTAAHKTLPLPALVEVTNLANGRQVILRVNDRGPFADGRIIDLSRGAADELGLRNAGVGEVRVRYVGRAPALGSSGPPRRSSGREVPVSANPRPVAPTSPFPPPSPPPGRSEGDYWVQAGAFADPVMAERLAQRLGERAQVERAEIRGQTLFRVRVGPWSDATAAERARQAIVARGVPDALLMTAD